MPAFKTKNGVFVTCGALQEAGLAVAFNIQNFLFKLKNINEASWQQDVEKLIRNNIHSVLAVHDQNDTYPLRMLNAGGVLTFVSDQDASPLGMMLLSEKRGLQLGFGKVELSDLHPQLRNIQNQIDAQLKDILVTLLRGCKDKDEFKEKIVSDEFRLQFDEIERVLIKSNPQFKALLEELSLRGGMHEQPGTFGRPSLNKYSVHAIQAAAVREIVEEIHVTAQGQPLDVSRFKVAGAVDREKATEYVRSKLKCDNPAKFTAREMNPDFESSTFVVKCALSESEFAGLAAGQGCQLVTPQKVDIEIVDAEKGMLQTTLAGYPPIQGGGNQFTVALVCREEFHKEAVFTVSAIAPDHSLQQPALLFSDKKSHQSTENQGGPDYKPH